jgi:Transferrin.
LIYFSAGVTKFDFELLCRDGSRRPVDDYANCYWGTVPTHTLVTSSATTLQQRKNYQRFFRVSMFK